MHYFDTYAAKHGQSGGLGIMQARLLGSIFFEVLAYFKASRRTYHQYQRFVRHVIEIDLYRQRVFDVSAHRGRATIRTWLPSSFRTLRRDARWHDTFVQQLCYNCSPTTFPTMSAFKTSCALPTIASSVHTRLRDHIVFLNGRQFGPHLVPKPP